MKYYFVANIKIDDPEEYQKYLNEVDHVFSKYNGKYLALDDTSSLDLFIRYLEDGSMRRLSYQSDLLEFYPANGSNLAKDNKALVIIKDRRSYLN